MISAKLRFTTSFLLSIQLLCLPAHSQTSADINTSDGIRIHYVSSGETNGHFPVILIPGWSFTSQIWQTQVEYFAKNRRD